MLQGLLIFKHKNYVLGAHTNWATIEINCLYLEELIMAMLKRFILSLHDNTMQWILTYTIKINVFLPELCYVLQFVQLKTVNYQLMQIFLPF